MHQVNLVIFSKGVYHKAIKVFNGLSDTLKINSSDPKKFKKGVFVYELLLYDGRIC
jgi:2,3-bisphosphoglycerate-independent phosphoglycerate mutase